MRSGVGKVGRRYLLLKLLELSDDKNARQGYLSKSIWLPNLVILKTISVIVVTQNLLNMEQMTQSLEAKKSRPKWTKYRRVYHLQFLKRNSLESGML